MNEIVASIVPDSIAAKLQSVCVIGRAKVGGCMSTLISKNNRTTTPTEFLEALTSNI